MGNSQIPRVRGEWRRKKERKTDRERKKLFVPGNRPTGQPVQCLSCAGQPVSTATCTEPGHQLRMSRGKWGKTKRETFQTVRGYLHRTSFWSHATSWMWAEWKKEDKKRGKLSCNQRPRPPDRNTGLPEQNRFRAGPSGDDTTKYGRNRPPPQENGKWTAFI